jgi:alpha-glucosidase
MDRHTYIRRPALKHMSLARRLTGALLLIAPLASHGSHQLELSSPDRQLRVTIDTGERLAFAISHRYCLRRSA